MKLVKKARYKNFSEEVLSPSEIMKIIDETSPLEVFKEHVSELYGDGQTFGISYTVEIDMRDGKVCFTENRPGTFGVNDDFKIVIGKVSEFRDFSIDDLISEDEYEIKDLSAEEQDTAKEWFVGIDDDYFDDGDTLYFKDTESSVDDWIEFGEKYREWDSYQERAEDAVLFYLNETDFEKPSKRDIEEDYYYNVSCEECQKDYYNCDCLAK